MKGDFARAHLHRLMQVAVLSLVLLCISCGTWLQSRPKITVVIIIDQFRADYLKRFAGYFSGGLARLLSQGEVFLNTHYDHACTETAPGHATLSTGCHPSRHGIIFNAWFDVQRSRSVYAVADSSVFTFESSALEGRSPHWLEHTALGDWLKQTEPGAKVISISRKDRAAILLGGRKPDAAYWYNPRNGGFTSSSYYLDQLPPWAIEWNNRHEANNFFGRAWDKSRPEEEYFASREDLFDGEEDAANSNFPHAFAAGDEQPSEAFYNWLTGTPFVDSLTLSFATTALRSEALGLDRTTDLLCISLSATDAVGHDYGPLSQEMQDNLMRLDHELGLFFSDLDRQVGLENCLIALSGDHGVLPLPEELRRRGFETARITAEEWRGELRGALVEVAEQLHTQRPLLKKYEDDLYLDYTAADSAGLTHAEFQRQVADKIKTLTMVSDVFTAGELASADTTHRDYVEAFRHAYFPGRSPDLVVRFRPSYLIGAGRTGTSHGSVYDYDNHVPMVFMGKGVAAGHVDRRCSVVDFAPTIAAAMGVDFPADIDGHALELK